MDVSVTLAIPWIHALLLQFFPTTVLLVILLTHFSYLFTPFLSNQTFSHCLWHICLLTYFWTLFSDYINHSNCVYINQAISLYLVNLFLPWNSNKYHLYSITSPLCHCKTLLAKTASLNHTWAEPRPRTLSWVSIKTYGHKNWDQTLVADTRSDA